MDAAKASRTVRDTLRMQASREELVERIASVMCEDGIGQPLQGLHLGRFSAPTDKHFSGLEPSLCVTAQGSKTVFVGDNRYQYDPSNYLLTTLELPRISQVSEASREKPYLSLRLVLEPTLVGAVMLEAGYVINTDMSVGEAINVSPIDADLLDAVVRLARLIDSPAHTRTLMPLIKQEIVYRLLVNDQGGRLSHLATTGGYTSTISRAIERLRQGFDQPVRIGELAQESGMSVSSFYQRFKSVTAMSPFQFRKRLRLQEARRIMLSEELDARSAAYRVGYVDGAHFSREYKSVFGTPPMRDVQRLRETTSAFPD